MEMIYISLSQGLAGEALEEFSALFTGMPKATALLPLHKALSDRHNVMLHADDLDPSVLRDHLSSQRDRLRKELHAKKVIDSAIRFQSLYVSYHTY